MDKEKADKFLSLDDRLIVQGIETTHEMGSNHPEGIAQDVLTFDGSNAETRHQHRGKLLGVIDRLLATTAAISLKCEAANKELESAEELRDALEQEAGALHRANSGLKTAYEKAAAELNAANAKLDQYQSFGDLKPWFGGPYAALTLKNGSTADRVFSLHEGVLWSFTQLSRHASNLKSENDQLRKLADKPMQIFDDAQGYYTVTDPFNKDASITVKELAQRNLRQKAMLDERDESVDALRRLNDEQINTINRKDEKILEQAREIKGLKQAVMYAGMIPPQSMVGMPDGGMIPPQSMVGMPDGGVLRLEDLINRYLSQVRTIRRLHEEADSYRPLKTKLRQTQEDLGDMTVAHNAACETIDKLNARLDKINDMALDISDVADGTTEPEFEETVDWGQAICSATVDNRSPQPGETWILDLETGTIKRKD